MANYDPRCALAGCDRVDRLTFKFGKWYCDSHLPIYDSIAHPKHYQGGGVEVIDAIDAWALNFARGNIVKYVARAGRKPGADELEDLKKALWYLQHEIERISK